MSHATADTSRDAYRSHRDSGELGAQQRKIMIFLHLKGGEFTRGEISQLTGIRLSSVCGRVAELLALGYLVERARRPCGVTGISAHPVKVTPYQMQLIAA